MWPLPRIAPGRKQTEHRLQTVRSHPSASAITFAWWSVCLQICAVCNDAQIVFDAEEGTYGRIGEPTEAALSVLVEKLGVPGVRGCYFSWEKR